MSGLVRLALKAQRPLLPLLAFVLAFQLLLGYTASLALMGRTPPLSLALMQRSADPLAADFAARLSDSDGITVIEVAPEAGMEEVFNTYDVQGIVVVPPDFAERINTQGRSLVFYQKAPGITDSAFACEQVGDVLLQTRAGIHLEEALDRLGAPLPEGEAIQELDLLETAYEGPGLQYAWQGDPPLFGVAALLLLLAYLHAALTLPTKGERRLLLRGRAAYRASYAAGLFALLLVWFALIVVYFIILALAGVGFSLFLPCAFAVIAAYGAVLAGAFSMAWGRTAATWLFVPFFLVSMTIGGGLWDTAVVDPWFAPLMPVAALSAAGAIAPQGLAALCLAALVLVAATLFIQKACTPLVVQGLPFAKAQTGKQCLDNPLSMGEQGPLP
ncbi:MAG: ABC transporter permease [Coriobacteriaceae bacterium]|nr:ABC transporter permease [Coriobacteriaceae bacterium]